MELKKLEINIILESLEYMKLNIEESTIYPTYEEKQKRLKEVESVIEKLRKLRNS